ncbi:MAG: lipid-transfer protein [Myxococcales bacterium]|nr:lipid-transfer protein [Myxococcales bacterium]
MGEKVFVVGVGMTKFEKPGGRDWDYPDMGAEAARNALADSGIAYELIEQAAIGYCYGDSTAGQRALYEVGLSGIPIVNVNNNCATGSSALFLAKQFIEGGLADCTLALGFEKMEKGSLGVKFTDRASPMGRFFSKMNKLRGVDRKAPGAPQMFGNAARQYMEKYGARPESFARIGEKNHRHSVNNPYSQFRDEYSLQDILDAPMVWDPLTKLQCCPTSDGGAAAVLASERFVREHGLEANAVEILAMAMTTDRSSTFDEGDMNLVGSDMTVGASRAVYEQSGFGPEDVDVIELHDCFSANEMITYEGLGLCEAGGAPELIDSGAVTYGGKVVVNPSGGLISKGHPLGATGLAQCAELNWQLRGEAELRQVDGAKIALQHNLGLGGACVVGMYRKADLP